MLSCICLLFLPLTAICQPANDKTPPDAQDLMRQFEKDEKAIQAKAAKEIVARRSKLVQDLKAVQEKYTKAGQLDEALAVRELVSALEKLGVEKIDIELLGGTSYRYKGKYVHGEGKYYKVKTSQSESVMTLKELEVLFAERKNQVSVILHITDESVEGPPRVELTELILQKKIRITYPAK